MKRIIFTLLVFSLCGIGYAAAQALDTIPNGDFERWLATNKAKAAPQGWDTIGGISYPISELDYTKDGNVIQRPVYDGKYALSLACQTRGNLIYLGIVECKFGMKYRDPYLDMNMAYMEGDAPQLPEFVVVLWNSKTHDTTTYMESTLASNNQYTNDTLEPWTALSIALDYTHTSKTDNTIPDSGIIELRNATVGLQGLASPVASVLYVEKMWFDNAVAASIPGITAVGNKSSASAYPNPFASKTTIHYALAQSGEVSLKVYDMQGKEIQTLVDGNQSSGIYNEVFDGTDLSNGVYMYRLQTANGVQTGKLILAR